MNQESTTLWTGRIASALTMIALTATLGCQGGLLPLTDGEIAGFLNQLSAGNNVSQGNQADPNTGGSLIDDNGGDRAPGTSDDPPGDDNGGDRNDQTASADTRIEAALTGNGAVKGAAKYRVEAGRRKFNVEVEHFAPGTYSVLLNGAAVAQITVGPLGTAEIEFDSRVEPDHVPLPDGFPANIKAGDTVDVGGMITGTF